MTPLSYESLKAVIRYLDVNLRFELLIKCPSIRTVEKLIPLKIHKLSIEPLQLSVNDFRYELKVIDRQGIDQIGCLYDVDPYGFQDRSLEMTPGDIVIEHPNRLTPEQARARENANMLHMEQQIERLVRRREAQKHPRTRDEIKSLSDIDSQIERYRLQLIPHYLRRDNAPSEYKHNIKFITQAPSITQRKEIVKMIEYNKKARVAMKYMMEKLFGGRSVPIRVDTFSTRHTKEKCFRLPFNIKFQIKKLEFYCRATEHLNAFGPVFLESSFPVESILIGKDSQYDHERIRTARKIIIYREPTNFPPGGLSHRRVDFTSFNSDNCRQILISIIRHWREHGRDIGSYYSVSTYLEKADQFFNLFKAESGAKIGELQQLRGTKFPKCIVLSMTNDAELNIYCERIPNVQDHRNWKLKIKVQQIGHATIVES